MEPRNAIVVFDDVPVRREWHDGEQWIAAIDVAKALGYDNPSRAASDMINHNPELFADYERIVSSFDGTQRRRTRVLNLKGIIAFCVRSNQPKAIPFQRWAVTILEKHISAIPSDVRLIAKQKRVKFTDTLRDHGCDKPYHYINITRDMKDGLGIDKNKPKDSCDLIEVMKIAASEDIARINMLQDKTEGYKECHDTSVKASALVAEGTKAKSIAHCESREG